MFLRITAIFIATLTVLSPVHEAAAKETPNIVLIYIDDLGYGDVGCYGATKVETPNVDRLAKEGLLFTDAHAAAATCTPSRYAMLTGQYAFRKGGTGILRGDAKMAIDTSQTTLASMLKEAGYATGVVGKWHLGLGNGDVDWNKDVKPGPLEIGFDYSFLIPATGDRVPCVYLENHRVVGLDPNDPIQVSYKGKVGDDPTGEEHPELLKLMFSHGHNRTIINGISRIGWMSGGKSARWVDEDMADVIAGKAVDFIERHKDAPFFLYFSTHDIHVPRVPHARFVGTSGHGTRGDVIQQMDWCTGEVLDALDRFGLTENTLVIFTSDNGPVLDDGYASGAEEDSNGHDQNGPVYGGKYSRYEGGTRVPMIVRWPGKVKPSTTSDALVSQVDFLASFAKLVGGEVPEGQGQDSEETLAAILGQSAQGREVLVEQGRDLALRRGPWKYFPTPPRKVITTVIPEHTIGQQQLLYNLDKDLGETVNVAPQYPELAKDMAAQLEAIRNQ